MATARDVISGALKRLQVLAAGETAASEDASDALWVFNRMLSGLKHEGVDLNITADLALNDTVPVNLEDLEAVEAILTAKLADSYEKSLSPVQALLADDGVKVLQAAYGSLPVLSVDPALIRI